MKKFLKFIPVLLLVPILTFCMKDSEAGEKEQVMQAIKETADYVSDVLLTDEGVSRCDYNIIEGKWYDYEPPWHTGQAIYALTEAYRVTDEEKYLDRAKLAGDWWVSLEIKDHPKLNGMINSIHGDHAGEVIVFATMSDGSPGLFKLYDLCEDEKYAEVPSKAGDWMMRNMYVAEEGVCYDNVDPETGEVMKENSPFWPEKVEQDLYDVARPNNEGSLFKDMYEYTGDEVYKDVFVALCNSLVEKQGPEGLWMDFMPNNKEEGSVHPRFNLWYAESLLDGFDLTGDSAYLFAAEKTARMYASFQDGDGTIYYKNYVDGRRDRSSVCGSSVAFSSMLWLRLQEHGITGFEDRIELSLQWILKNRYAADHPDSNLAGAVLNTRLRHKKGKLWYTQRDVGSIFGLRFLVKYYEYKYEFDK